MSAMASLGSKPSRMSTGRLLGYLYRLGRRCSTSCLLWIRRAATRLRRVLCLCMGVSLLVGACGVARRYPLWTKMWIENCRSNVKSCHSEKELWVCAVKSHRLSCQLHLPLHDSKHVHVPSCGQRSRRAAQSLNVSLGSSRQIREVSALLHDVSIDFSLLLSL